MILHEPNLAGVYKLKFAVAIAYFNRLFSPTKIRE